MEVNILKEDGESIEVEIKGERHTLPNLLRKELWNIENTATASYGLEHPLVSSPVLILRVKSGKPRKVLLQAVENLKKKNKELKGLLKKLEGKLES